jgi:hypothetical protein
MSADCVGSGGLHGAGARAVGVFDGFCAGFGAC